MPRQQIQSPLLLLRVSKDADEDHRRMQIACHIHVIDGYQSGFANGEFAADDFADLAFEQFPHTLESKRRHREDGIDD
jgi:hypothetical protein